MRNFFRYLVAIIFQFILALTLISISIRFQILDPNFLITSFRSADVYQQSVELFSKYLEGTLELELQAAGLDQLPIEQREFIENEVKQIASAIEEHEVQDFIETNIYRFFAYMNGESNNLILYFPVHSWGLPELITLQEPFSILSENTTLETIMEAERAVDVKAQLLQVKGYIKLVKTIWFLPLVLLLLLLLIHYLLSKSPQRFKPTAWLLIISGIYTLLMCGTTYIASNEFIKRTASYGEAVLLMIGTIVPHLFLTIIYLWAEIALALITVGIVVLIAQLVITKGNERKQKRLENSIPEPAIPTTTQPPQESASTQQ